ncbi:hypothetical protein GUITHDRAFT_108836 [Guillardia theta CCMP2712]|uniref:Uncharacterized protein n=1 Tax=Guillardia theta (strain CCMP2712) TaxID=905079 RepID=L1JAR9_GUITC|nr:hypothetical protein GUITHDRAFT_108836 [Guillardia theta CCMP2712]EKX45194.1 hypothetical protein GUITHDRAFT_108836 [Guillardia theta CCMP2712]|eukprot:XP_005832174.1 hypothetical protein GUITHDRAFT_108836 [Guillardia theta CCMP2712]
MTRACRFPLWVLAGGVLGVTRPAALAWLKGDLITASLALTMLFMGMTLDVKDFQRVMQSPRQVFLGFMCQFTIMPFLGWSMAKLFGLSPAFAVGLILVSACPGGTASNLVTLIAKADVALSVLMTTVSTMAAPIMTPLLTSILAGSLVPVDASGLLISTLQVVLAPVGLGLAINTFAPAVCKMVSGVTPLLCVVLVSLICGSVIAQTASSFIAAGLPLLGAVIGLHLGGFLLGYFVPRILGYPEPISRTVSIETGMQNSALGVVLATRNFADPLTALPCAISATCHSVLGSSFAAYWRLGGRKKEEPKDPSRGNVIGGFVNGLVNGIQGTARELQVQLRLFRSVS